MKSAPKLIRRFIGILLLSTVLILILNFVAFIIIGLNQIPNDTGYSTAREMAMTVSKTDSGYVMDEASLAYLEKHGIWAALIGDDTRSIVWQTDSLPSNIPRKYTLSDIASLTLGYLDGYPTFTDHVEGGLLLLGYPRESFWKHMWPSWDYDFIAQLPLMVLILLFCNALLIFLIYFSVTGRLIKSVVPIVLGIQDLPSKQQVYVPERGVLSEIAFNINTTSEILQYQKRQLMKRETARANWIAGVSHDIRTPLSMVMGYAGQLANDLALPEDARKKSAIILRQSAKIRDLINDLNLASRLEYDMQPLNLQKINAIALIRQVVADFMNLDVADKYPIEWRPDEGLFSCLLHADGDLLKRAVGNLIQNCMSHNEDGCGIYVSLCTSSGQCIITVEDNGSGCSEDEIQRLNGAPHYMACDDAVSGQRHGLGLLIVRQVAASHHGTISIGASRYGGLQVKLILPCEQL